MEPLSPKTISEKTIAMINTKLEQLKVVEQQLETLKKYMLTNNFIEAIQKIQSSKNISINFNSQHTAHSYPESTPQSDSEHEHESESEHESEHESESTPINVAEANKPVKFTPSQKDQLFWCFYIIYNGLENYETISNHFLTENEFKIKTVELANKHSELLKQHKISKNIFESCIQSTFTPLCLNAYCILYNINVFYIHKNSFYEMIYVKNCFVNIIEKEENTYRVHLPTMKNINKRTLPHEIILHQYRNNAYKLDNLEKPLRPFSSYSLPDLVSISNKLKISLINNDNKKKTKKELYDEILQKL